MSDLSYTHKSSAKAGSRFISGTRNSMIRTVTAANDVVNTVASDGTQGYNLKYFLMAKGHADFHTKFVRPNSGM